MAISVVVVGLAFFVLGLLKKNVFLIGQNLNKKTEQRLFEEQLNIDLQLYPQTRFEKGKLIFSSPLDSIDYQFEKEYIVRDLDTFYLAPQKKEFYFLGKTTNNGILDACKFTFEKDRIKRTLFSYKRNDAKSSMTYGN